MDRAHVVGIMAAILSAGDKNRKLVQSSYVRDADNLLHFAEKENTPLAAVCGRTPNTADR
jgi:hypothetical protein